MANCIVWLMCEINRVVRQEESSVAFLEEEC